MATNSELLPTNEDIRVYHRNISGNEISIANWIDLNINQMMENFDVDSFSNVAILVRGNRTANIINEHLVSPHKIIEQSLLESDGNDISILFDNILKFVFDDSHTITEVIELFVSLDTLSIKEQEQLHECFIFLNEYFNRGNSDFSDVRDKFKLIASILMASKNVEVSMNLLENIVSNQLDIYSGRNDNKIQILTLHKSKGLEFDIVFHLDLYEWVLPAKIISNGTPEYVSFEQDLNLHYVGITRAKKACVLCTSTKRTNGQFQQKNGSLSEFFAINNLYKLRN